jgi:hypothetical protein
MMTAMAVENPALTLTIVPTAESCLLRSSPARLGSKPEVTKEAISSHQSEGMMMECKERTKGLIKST